MTISTLISPESIQDFRRTVWDYYRAHRRSFPWREHTEPYYVLVSELMLQQTQVSRVQAKFGAFIRRFPTVQRLAAASLAEVLEAWVGLGYNRRAKFLWQAAGAIVAEHGGVVPRSFDDLVRLPGVGANTAGAILAYAHNEPVVFVETNIRTVYIHHFFGDQPRIGDAAIRHLVAQTLPPESPREWYWALMDYGTHLKATVGGQLHRVQAYRRQSQFQGSRRQLRGQVLRELVRHKRVHQDEFAVMIADDRLPEVLDALIAEGMVTRRGGLLQLT